MPWTLILSIFPLWRQIMVSLLSDALLLTRVGETEIPINEDVADLAPVAADANGIPLSNDLLLTRIGEPETTTNKDEEKTRTIFQRIIHEKGI